MVFRVTPRPVSFWEHHPEGISWWSDASSEGSVGLRFVTGCLNTLTFTPNNWRRQSTSLFRMCWKTHQNPQLSCSLVNTLIKLTLELILLSPSFNWSQKLWWSVNSNDRRLALFSTKNGSTSQVLSILLAKYGGDLNEFGVPANPPDSIYACAHDWVSQGNVRTDGIVKYYEAYYKNG